MSTQEERVIEFYAKGGPEKALQYPLDADSIVVDLGAYEGKLCFAFQQRYNCQVYGLDAVPQPIFASQIEEKGLHSKIVSVGYGIAPGEEECEFDLCVCGDATSAYIVGENKTRGILKPLAFFLASYQLQHIDLLTMNIEGGEYDLLDYLIHSKWIQRIQFIQIQFHTMVPNCENRYQQIVQGLLKTHRRLYCFPWVWEAWFLRFA